jgi:hypothetical protein
LTVGVCVSLSLSDAMVFLLSELELLIERSGVCRVSECVRLTSLPLFLFFFSFFFFFLRGINIGQQGAYSGLCKHDGREWPMT